MSRAGNVSGSDQARARVDEEEEAAYISVGGSPPVAAHRCVSVDTIGGRAGLFCKTFSRSSQFMCVNLDTCWEGEREREK